MSKDIVKFEEKSNEEKTKISDKSKNIFEGLAFKY